MRALKGYLLCAVSVALVVVLIGPVLCFVVIKSLVDKIKNREMKALLLIIMLFVLACERQPMTHCYDCVQTRVYEGVDTLRQYTICDEGYQSKVTIIQEGSIRYVTLCEELK